MILNGSRLQNDFRGQQARGDKMIKLSIIIPCYNAEPYIDNLMNVLKPQVTDEIEIIVIDDCSRMPYLAPYPWIKVIRQEKNTGPGIARNTGLDAMHGKYFTFIDADDLVADNYIETILKKIDKEKFDYCYLSWKTMPGGWNCTVQLKSVEDKFPGFNLCVWNRVYKTATFGKHRFNPKKLWSEDADFIYRLNEHGKKSFVPEIMYYYRSDTPDSWTKRMFRGDLDYTRIVYNLREVKPDDKELLEEIKAEYEDNEIVLLTNKNGIPELEHYCMIMPYNTPTKGMELRGDQYGGFSKIEKPIRTQVVIWTAVTQQIGGIETWIYQFCKHMSKYYDIMVMYDTIDANQLARLQDYVECVRRYSVRRIICDTCIINRITDKVPENVIAKQTIQMVHACKMQPQWEIPQDHDYIVAVSHAAADSFGEKKAQIIYNFLDKPTEKKCLILISATRLHPVSAVEKGYSRMLKLADMLNEEGIPFLWLIFTDSKPDKVRENMIILPPILDIAPYLSKADYYVSLSDAEGYGYSIAESLNNSTAVITTPINVLPELGFKDGFNGYEIPFDMKFDVKKLLNIPVFKNNYINTGMIKQWRRLLGDTKPTNRYNPGEYEGIICIKQYTDIQLGKTIKVGEMIRVKHCRAQEICDAGYARRV